MRANYDMSLAKRLTIPLLLCAGVFLLGVACSAPRRSERDSGRDALRIGLPSDLTSLDRARIADINSWAPLANLYENLLQIRPGTDQVEPALAESWQVSTDGRIYTFNLRKAVKFHNGRPLTAQDVVFSLRRFLDPGSAAPTRQWLARVASADVVSPSVVRLTLSQPDANVLTTLAVLPGVLCAETFKETGERYFQYPIGTGPFRFVRYEPARQLVLERFPEYWGSPAGVAQVQFKVIPDENARVLALRRGEIDLVPSTSLSPNLLDDLAKEGFRLAEIPTAGLQYLGFDNSRWPFSNRSFRQALAYSVNREAIINGLLRGHALPALGPLPGVFPQHSSQVVDYTFDFNKAREALAASGVPSNVSIELSYGSEHPWNDQLAQIVQSDWRKLGLQVILRKYDFGTFMSNLIGRKYAAFTVDIFAGNGSPDLFLHDLFASTSSLNFFGYKNPEFDRAVRDADTVDAAMRLTALARAQRILSEDSPAVFVFDTKQGFLYSARVQGLVPGRFQEMVLKRVHVR
jgi:peptide/nickel transport system substrate-binding protein